MKKLTLAAALLAAGSAAAQTAAPTPAAPRPATGAVEVAAIVAREFPAYDKDANGGLSQVEFDAWMMRQIAAQALAEFPRVETSGGTP